MKIKYIRVVMVHLGISVANEEVDTLEPGLDHVVHCEGGRVKRLFGARLLRLLSALPNHARCARLIQKLRFREFTNTCVGTGSTHANEGDPRLEGLEVHGLRASLRLFHRLLHGKSIPYTKSSCSERMNQQRQFTVRSKCCCLGSSNDRNLRNDEAERIVSHQPCDEWCLRSSRGEKTSLL